MENLPSFDVPRNPPILSPIELAQTIDHTLLDPKATHREFEILAQETLKYGFKSACVPPTFVDQTAQLLRHSQSLVCTVLNFPLGQSQAGAVLKEAEIALQEGAQELDVVIPIGPLLGKNYRFIYDLLAPLCGLQVPVKVIIETAYLTEPEIVIAAKLSEAAGATFVKTSTGFALKEPKGAVPRHVQLLRQILNSNPSKTFIKASGGIRTRESALLFLACGADRIGTSNGVTMMTIAEPSTPQSQPGTY